MQAVNGLFLDLHALHSDGSLCVQRSGRLFLPFTTQLANTSSFAQVTKDLRDRQAEVWGLLRDSRRKHELTVRAQPLQCGHAVDRTPRTLLRRIRGAHVT